MEMMKLTRMTWNGARLTQTHKMTLPKKNWLGAAEKLDTMMAKVQPPLTSSLHLRILVRCRLVAPGQIDYLPGPLPREVC